MRGEVVADPFGSLVIWTHPVPGRQYVVGVDSSGGHHGSEKENDPSAACVIDMRTCEQVAEWSGFYIPRLWGFRVARLAWLYNAAHLAIETHPSPHGINVYDAAVAYGYPNLSCALKHDHRDGRITEKKGWARPQGSVEYVYNRVREAMRDGCVIRSEALLDELAGVNIQDGKLDKKSKNDRIIAYALSLLARDQAFHMGEVKKTAPPPMDLADLYWKRKAESYGHRPEESDAHDDCWDGV